MQAWVFSIVPHEEAYVSEVLIVSDSLDTARVEARQIGQVVGIGKQYNRVVVAQ